MIQKPNMQEVRLKYDRNTVQTSSGFRFRPLNSFLLAEDCLLHQATQLSVRDDSRWKLRATMAWWLELHWTHDFASFCAETGRCDGKQTDMKERLTPGREKPPEGYRNQNIKITTKTRHPLPKYFFVKTMQDGTLFNSLVKLAWSLWPFYKD